MRIKQLTECLVPLALLLVFHLLVLGLDYLRAIDVDYLLEPNRRVDLAVEFLKLVGYDLFGKVFQVLLGCV